MRILHTGDWHIGQTLNGFDRAHEFRAVLAELAEIVRERDIDALVVAGDVFDTQNPSGEAQGLLYDALVALHRARPALQIIMTAGNHDAAGRLEAPRGLLEAVGTRVVGNIRWVDGKIDARRHLLPLYDPRSSITQRQRGTAAIAAHVLAVSYPTAACLPHFSINDGQPGSSVARATAALYGGLMDGVRPALAGLPLIVTGHLHVAGGDLSEGAERRILVGGEHAVAPSIFPDDATYVALGHLHKMQRVGRDTVRYCGSLLPLSASELGYRHSVTLVTLDGLAAPAIEQIALRRPVAFERVPKSGSLKITELADHLAALVASPAFPTDLAAHPSEDRRPFVQLALERQGLKADYLTEVDAIMDKFPLRRIGSPLVAWTEAATPMTASAPGQRLAELAPEDLFRRAFERKHERPPGPEHVAAFQSAEFFARAG
jgi:DNA repair protein SbcD/Mre11